MIWYNKKNEIPPFYTSTIRKLIFITNKFKKNGHASILLLVEGGRECNILRNTIANVIGLLYVALTIGSKSFKTKKKLKKKRKIGSRCVLKKVTCGLKVKGLGLSCSFHFHPLSWKIRKSQIQKKKKNHSA